MASQIIPLTDLDKTGVVKDQPSVSLPPNVFTDVRNMRFRHGAVRKMEGDSELFNWSGIKYVAYWPNPNIGPTDGYWVVVRAIAGGNSVWIFKASQDRTQASVKYSGLSDGVWQHTLFQGGFGFILNNGVDRPIYILDEEGNTATGQVPNAAVLPGWDSYVTNERVVSSTFLGERFGYIFDLGQRVDFSMFDLEVTRDRQGTEVEFLDTDIDTDFIPGTLPSNPVQESGNVFTTYLDTETNTTVLHIGSGLAVNDTLTINIQSREEVNVRAGVIRSFGDILVAGNLTEYVGTNTIRRLAGVVRTSDVAQAGAIPNNWNPFDEGASTADEFTLSDTGEIQDMVELQGRLYIYTHNSIHALSLTGQTAAPVSFQPVTRQYGAMTMNAVQEYDGKHLVVGSSDIYLFGGHPGNIQSVAEGRVRDYFYDTFDGDSEALDAFQIVRNQSKDELWLCYKTNNASEEEALVFNYRMNTWTIRDIPAWQIVGDAPLRGTDPNITNPIFANATSVWQGDFPNVWDRQGVLERTVAPISPEFNTESIMGLALWTQGTGDLTISYTGTDIPSLTDPTYTGTATFDVSSDYKSDIRMNGRFLNYRITDNSSDNWNLSGMQIEVSQGGKR